MKGRNLWLTFAIITLCFVMAHPFAAGGEKKIGNLLVKTRKLNETDIQKMKDFFGVYDPAKKYGKLVQGHGTGFRPPTELEWLKLEKRGVMIESVKRTDGKTKISASVDHTTSNYFPPIGTQGAENCCTCFSAIYYMKTFQEAKEHGWDLSGASWEGGYYGAPASSYQNKIFSPDFVYHQINDGQNQGSSFIDATDVLTHIGAATWHTMPYDSTDSASWPPEAAWREAPLYRCQGEYQILSIDSPSGLTQLKQFLDNEILVQVVVDSSRMYEMTTTDDYDSSFDPDHAVTVVGYDESKSYSEDGTTHTGAFKIANSWGDSWTGETTNDGCFWISDNCMMNYMTYAYYFEDRVGYNPRILAVFEISHPDRANCSPYLMIGGSDETLWYSALPSSSISSGWNDFPVSPALEVETGDAYRLTLASSKLYDSSNCYHWGVSSGDVYPADSNDFWGGDYTFKTYTSGDVLDQSQTLAPYYNQFALDYPAWQNIIPAKSPLTKISMNLGYTGSPGYLFAMLTTAPSDSKAFIEGWDVGPKPFPSNKMALDITEFLSSYNAGDRDFYLKVLDKTDSETGVIDWFSIEIYDNYLSGTPTDTYISAQTPMPIPDGETVYVMATEPRTAAGAHWNLYE